MTINLPVLALTLALIFYGAGWRRLGISIITLVAACFMTILLFPVSKWLAAPLENDFVRAKRPQEIFGIVILGGSFDRILAGAELAHAYPAAKIVITGHTFANDGARALAAMGVDRSRLMAEEKSQDTWGDLNEAKALAAPQPGQVWLLVSAAMHMPRAMGVARHMGWTLLPMATHYLSRSQEPNFDFAAKASDVNEIMHEYMGLLAYRLEGRTDALFPRPSP